MGQYTIHQGTVGAVVTVCMAFTSTLLWEIGRCPFVSLLEGFRRSSSPWLWGSFLFLVALFLVLFPLLSLYFLASSLIRNLDQVTILHTG